MDQWICASLAFVVQKLPAATGGLAPQVADEFQAELRVSNGLRK